jgi:hypothetical protein
MLVGHSLAVARWEHKGNKRNLRGSVIDRSVSGYQLLHVLDALLLNRPMLVCDVRNLPRNAAEPPLASIEIVEKLFGLFDLVAAPSNLCVELGHRFALQRVISLQRSVDRRDQFCESFALSL